MHQVPSSVESMFVAAGWQPSAHNLTAEPASATQHAAAVIAQFGGLRVGATGAGQEQAKSNIHFYSTVRPESEIVVRPWRFSLGQLVAIANAHNDHIIVFVSTAGHFYAFTDPDDQLYEIGQTFGEAVERLLLGIKYGSSIPRGA